MTLEKTVLNVVNVHHAVNVTNEAAAASCKLQAALCVPDVRPRCVSRPEGRARIKQQVERDRKRRETFTSRWQKRKKDTAG